MTICTHSGKTINLLRPRAEDIALGDIVTSLERLPRYLGHTTRPWSVLDHSIMAYELAGAVYGRPLAIQALFHDAAEAYIGDIPAPIRRGFPDFDPIELRLLETIAEALALPWPFDLPCIRPIDMACRWVEGAILHPAFGMERICPPNPLLPHARALRAGIEKRENPRQRFVEICRKEGILDATPQATL